MQSDICHSEFSIKKEMAMRDSIFIQFDWFAKNDRNNSLLLVYKCSVLPRVSKST